MYTTLQGQLIEELVTAGYEFKIRNIYLYPPGHKEIHVTSATIMFLYRVWILLSSSTEELENRSSWKINSQIVNVWEMITLHIFLYVRSIY